ncbi:hypothetical protein FRZ00_21990 [Streptomyces mobaraensis]|uniref:Uncharacterized protein n=1 Tax=Streptomyces mobaraensis TaxID=35621 RepID=A0A5N5W5Q1_STRMB|nr:hypothetical protein FRZ00_21990 [Streptomyces mobaraensis]
MTTHIANGTSRFSCRPRVRESAVPPSVIETATARRHAGDWAGRPAAGRARRRGGGGPRPDRAVPPGRGPDPPGPGRRDRRPRPGGRPRHHARRPAPGGRGRSDSHRGTRRSGEPLPTGRPGGRPRGAAHGGRRAARPGSPARCCRACAAGRPG